MVLPVNGMRTPRKASDCVGRVCPPRSSSANWWMPSKIPGTMSRPTQRSSTPGCAASTFGPEGEGTAVSRDHPQGEPRSLGQLPGGGLDERVPLLIGVQVSEDRPDLLRCCRDAHNGRDGPHPVALLTEASCVSGLGTVPRSPLNATLFQFSP